MSEIEKAAEHLAKPVPNLIDEFNAALMHMDEFRQGLAEVGDWEALAHGLVQLAEFKKNLSILIESIEGDIYNNLPEKKVVVEGFGIIERRTSTSKKWDSEVLLNHLVRSTLDNGTGEITPDDVFRLVDTLKKVLPFTPSLGWRSTALEQIGIDPKEYSDVTFGRKTVTIKR